MATSAGYGLLFANLEKYNGTNVELTTWLRQFDRCCVVANKIDDLVKGQLLMIFVTGQAKAILEDFEVQTGEHQKYSDLSALLIKHYDTTANREHKMAAFEVRTQNIDETEEEFMFELYNLYTSANPDLDPEIQTTAIKRKFLQGISPEIKRNIFVFCNDPYATAVSRDKLLEYCRNAKVYLSAQSSTNSSATIGNVSREENSNGDSSYSGRNEVLSAIERLNTQLQQHVNQTEERLTAQNEVLAALGRSNFRGRGSVRGRYLNSPNRFSRGSRGRGNIRARTSTDNNTQNVCFKCGGINHYARNCLSGN